jgi:hypothetical protein
MTEKGRTYKRIGAGYENTYYGFNGVFDEKTQYVAIVRCEDRPEAWALDDPQNLDGLSAYLTDSGGPYKIIGVFEKEPLWTAKKDTKGGQ